MFRLLQPRTLARLYSPPARVLVGALLPLLLVGLFLGSCGEPAPSATTLLRDAQANFSVAQSFPT